MPTTPKGYTTQALIEAYIGASITGTQLTSLNDFIDEVEVYIDKQTSRNFKADTTATARVFDGDGSPTVRVDDCVAITKVEVGVQTKTEVLSVDYITEPANAVARLSPITTVRLLAAVFPKYPQVITVTAKWGYSTAIPSDIKAAATILAANVIMNGIVIPGIVSQETIGRYSVQYKAGDGELVKMDKLKNDAIRAQRILDSYRRFSF